MHAAPVGVARPRGLRRPEDDPRQWEAECAGKDAYTSESAALAVLASIKALGRERKACWLSSYRCSFCGGFHLGNSRH